MRRGAATAGRAQESGTIAAYMKACHMPRRFAPARRELTMTHENRAAYVTRNDILKLLSNEETARVSSAETAAQLAQGDEFIDLAQVEKGVQRAGKSNATDNVLPRKAVGENTWLKIVKGLSPARS
jgi:hypothetical protein